MSGPIRMWLGRWHRRLQVLIAPNRAWQEMDEEMQFHLEMEIDELVRGGMDRPEARRQARVRFGGVERFKEEGLEARGLRALDDLSRDLRYAIRGLKRAPGFSLVVVLTLALGVGANTAIYSVVSGILLQPLPYQQPGQLVTVWEHNRSYGNTMGQVSPPNFADWREQSRSFTALSAGYWWSATITGGEGAERVLGAVVTPGTFSEVLGVPPAGGRGFVADDATEGAAPVVILSDGLWQRRFGADPDIIGRSVELNGLSRIVVGVMPAGFSVPTYPNAELWCPLTWDPSARDRSSHFLRVIGRLAPTVTIRQAHAEMGAIMARLEREYPEHNDNTGANVVSLQHYVVGHVERALYILLGAVGFVLLIACANVANLILARSSVREREFALRGALGAARQRLVRQVLSESMVLAALGGAAGLLMAFWGMKLLIALSPPGIPRLDQIGINAQVLVFTLVVTAATGLIVGLIPALQNSRSDVVEAIKDGGRSTTAGRAGLRLRNALVVGQVSIVLVLLVGAGLLTRSFAKLVSEQIGFDAEDVVVAGISLAGRYDSHEERTQFVGDVLERLSQRPEATSVGAAMSVPFVPWEVNSSFTIVGHPPPDPNNQPDARINCASSTYLQTIGVPLVRGRGFTERDGPGSPGVVIINEVAARRYWPGEDPVGQRIDIGGWGQEAFEIVGVAGNTRFYGLDREATPEILIPYAQVPFRFVNIVARVPGRAQQFIPAIREAVRELDPNIPVHDGATMNQLIGRSAASKRFYMVLLGLFATVAAVLTAVGIYGLLSYSVARRSNEISVRIALGAQTGRVLRQVILDGCRLAALGVVPGLIVTIVLSRMLTPLLYEVDATDPIALLTAGSITVLIAVLASYLPARRATRVDPAEALRAE
ncbi:MAG: FtsX-like permease family protein [Gemmatimonadales bacterium]|nr:FtsX-like permease family protein [Gemmatimonadales bacterium]